MKMVYVLFAAVAAGAVIGGVRSVVSSSSVPEPAAEPLPAARPPMPAMPPGIPADEPSVTVEGEVLEVIDVPSYSYLRIGAKGDAGQWAAVRTAPLKVGDHARVLDAMKMSQFTSPVLKRTFPVIYFGTLEGAEPAAGDPSAPGGMGMDPDEAMKTAHAGTPGEPQAVPVKPVERAKGPEGRTVAETIAQRTRLAGQKVRIHATVVKSTPRVLGHTYLHIRDGSADPAGGAADLAVVTDQTPAVGDTITVEGVVAIDRDVGSGYKFPTIVEDARILPAP